MNKDPESVRTWSPGRRAGFADDSAGQLRQYLEESATEVRTVMENGLALQNAGASKL